ncbi:MAG TPA: pitrilysin family protein [Gemmatimonadales bacterium]|nr:pitrilysin family protein [Gemmatimonadales bacterium]
MRTLLLAACLLPTAATAQTLSVPTETFTLPNGLTVVVHENHENPLVAVNVWYHVGSGREVEGRSGFAHLFEHMMFQGSANVADEQHFGLVQEAGGTLNGSTNTDRTNYFETVPSNYLAMAMWLEADRMGWFLDGITQEKLDNQRDVVKNERRQNYENRPYGLASMRVNELLYPDDHPYHWPTIGYQADLSAASLADVKAFFQRWYGPNNATLVVAGDVTAAEVRTLAAKYFGPIPAGPAVEKPAPHPATLTADKRATLEDRVTLARLTLTWPGIEMWNADEAPLTVLAGILGSGKTGRLYERLVYTEEVAQSVSAFSSSAEIAGAFSIILTARDSASLTQLERETLEEIARLAADGPTPAEVQQAVTRAEAASVFRLASVAGVANQINSFQTFQGRADLFNEDLARYRAVTPADIRRVARAYLDGKPKIALSVVPLGRPELAAQGRGATP